MAYSLEVEEHTERKFRKLAKKDKAQLKIINRKVQEILENPYQFKPLRGTCMAQEECI